ncbi:hypothetical protein ACIODS_32940 [Micromonospora chalcea]|uniref:DUF6414 family protein n=1 Tax=Micromonospora chalcea TaxID=1874 RepID=UPI0037F92EAA
MVIRINLSLGCPVVHLEDVVILREFLYVDTDKVRSLVAQMNGGVTEEIKEVEKKEGKGGVGVKGFVTREGVWSKEESASKSAADAVFPTLEDELYSQGYLADISADLGSLSEEDFGEFSESYPPGSVVRLTAPGRLFDARYVTQVLAGISAVVKGLVTFDSSLLAPKAAQGGKGRGQQGRPGVGKSRVQSDGLTNQLEDAIPDYPDITALSGTTAEHLRAIVQISRGMFSPGLHMHINTGLDDRIAVTARLQEGRRFLDSDAEILFARYGTEAQDWTIVGTIGTFPREVNPEQDANFVDPRTSKISRAETLRTINDVMRELGALGMADFPRYPGFSIVPFAVYRPIGKLRTYEGTVATGVV